VAEKIKKGFFLSFEGPEGSGKSTQLEMLFRRLVLDGYDVCRTAEPGGTDLGKKIRDILLERDEIRLGSLAELFLFEADRAQHIEEIIKPELSRNKVVVCDRFNTATFAYQGYGLGMDMGLIESVDGFCRQGTEPDLTVIIDIDFDTGMARATSGGKADRMEKRAAEFHAKVRQGYLNMAGKEPERIKVIDGSGSIDDVHAEIKREVYALIERHKRSE